MSLFQSNLRKQISELPTILKSVKNFHYYSLLFIRVLTFWDLVDAQGHAPQLDAEPALRAPREGLRGERGLLAAALGLWLLYFAAIFLLIFGKL